MPTLQFKGKNTIWNHHLSIPYHTLDEVKNLDYKPENGEGNLIIEGDNLIALKALMPIYRGEIKCIYIDPPYNTGKENWVYNDNVNNPLMKEWFGKVVGLDDLTRHDKWLCMIVPRLKLLRDLLSEDGTIFISIDDNEVYNLREIMNEVFGEENYIALLPTIMNLKGNNDQYAFSGTHEYSLVYSKIKSKSKFYEFDIEDENIEEEWETDSLGYFKKGSGLLATSDGKYREDRPYMYFPVLIKEDKISLISEDEYKNIYNEYTRKFDDIFVDKIVSKYKKLGFECILPVDQNGNKLRWTWGFDGKFIKDVDDIIITNTKNGISLNKKQRPTLGDLPSKKPKSIFYKPKYSSGNGTNELKELFGEKIFNNPKPVELIKDFLQIGSGKNDIILDSFAGSGTAAQAVLELNKEGGNRKFILIQMKEITKEEPDKNLCKNITRERVKRAIEKNKYKSGFKYLKVGLPIDAETMLAGELPDYNQLAKFVYYLCTGKNLIEESKIKDREYYVGQFGSSVIYLIYKKDFDVLKNLALTLELAEKFKSQNPKKRIIVYAPACFLDEEYLTENQISYVGIPYNLFEKTS